MYFSLLESHAQVQSILSCHEALLGSHLSGKAVISLSSLSTALTLGVLSLSLWAVTFTLEPSHMSVRPLVPSVTNSCC